MVGGGDEWWVVVMNGGGGDEWWVVVMNGGRW